MPAIVRSYYDPIILGSLLRWLRPQEVWWGADEGDEDLTISILLERSNEAGARQLLPELLLAAAQGKVPLRSRELLMAKARVLLSSRDPEFDAPVELGLHLLSRAERSNQAPAAA